MTYPTNTVQHDASRVSRAMATLRFTGTRTTCRWLATLCKAKYVEAAAVEKLDASGYHVQHAWGQPVRFNRTDARRVY